MDKEAGMNEGTDHRRILIVDDDDSICRTLKRILKKIDSECTSASSAEEARRILKKGRFDLIFCDVILPKESGMDLIRHVLAEHTGTAVIMISGVEDPDIVEKALEIGAYGYVLKPFKISEVLINVSSALRRQRLEIESLRQRERLEQMVERRTASLQETLEGVVKVVVHTVETRDPYTAGHQSRVADLACAIAEKMEYAADQVKGIRMAGMIHDLGKISIPAEILSKPSRLTETEFALIKTHPGIGYDIIKGINFPWPVAKVAYQHHERMDGSGYPEGLKGQNIILEARIMAVADVVEAMASHRPYRPALGIEKALEEISENKSTLYDPETVDACLDLFAKEEFGFK
ncbi:MAG: response regulator [Desulfobacterales bacterium]|nr:response regulator [Desulfobacterales bacterium]